VTDDRNRIVAGMDELEYHRHPALSVSGAKGLLRPSCPALFRHAQDNPPESKPAFDYGTAAHKLLLGSGPKVEWFDAPDWRSKKAQEWAAACRLEGIVPLLKHQYEQIADMVDALRAHELAAALFEEGTGNAEVSAFWHDPTFDVHRRCRFDWLPFTDGGRLIIPDYKTCQSASKPAIEKTIASYRYHMQAAWYADLAFGLGIAEEVVFLFVFQEKRAPYLVHVVEADADAMRMGRGLNDQALETYVQCTTTNTWPGYADDVTLVSLPTWAHYEYHEITEEN
jgi:hypothetical protein